MIGISELKRLVNRAIANGDHRLMVHGGYVRHVHITGNQLWIEVIGSGPTVHPLHIKGILDVWMGSHVVSVT